MSRLHLRPVVGEQRSLAQHVRWVHSTELTLPARYLRGGELVCTVGTSLLDGGSCHQFVEELVAADAVGMCFGTGDVHQQIPDAIVTACRESGLPLIEVPHGVRFLALSEYLADYRMNAESELSARGERLVARLLADVRRAVALEDLAATAAAGLAGQLEAVVAGTRVTAGQPVEDGTPIRVTADLGDEVQVEWLGVDNPPSIDLLTQIARVLDVAAFERETERVRQRERIGQLLSLVADGMADVAAVVSYLESAQLGSGEVIVSAWPAGTAAVLAGLLPDAVIGDAPDVSYAVTSSGKSVLEAAQTLHLTCGYGSAVSLGSLARGIAEARACLELGRRQGRVVGPQELTSLDGLLEQQPPERLRPFAEQLLRPLRAYDEAHRGHLVDTLRTFLRTDGSLQATARTHYLHVNTVRHRLGRIHQLSGRDPTRFDDRVALAIALWTYDRPPARSR